MARESARAKTVLITGCRSGFGLLAAVAAARAGHRVWAGLRDLSTADGLREAAGELDVTPIQLDVTRDEERAAAVARVREEGGRLDVLVNNAGIAVGGFQEQFDEDEVRAVFEVNVFAVWALTRAFLPMMRAQGSGLVVNISSMSGRMALPGLGVYAGSKFALEGMSESLRHELRPFGIRVALVEPGPYRTDIFARNRRVCRAAGDDDGPYAEFQRRIEAFFERQVERGELGDPAEVADVIVRLIDDPRPPLRSALGPGVRPRLWLRRLVPFGLEERIVDRLLR